MILVAMYGNGVTIGMAQLIMKTASLILWGLPSALTVCGAGAVGTTLRIIAVLSIVTTTILWVTVTIWAFAFAAAVKINYDL